MEEEVFLFEKSSPVQVAWYRSKQKKKIYHFNGVQNNREAIDVQPWNAASRLKTGFCRLYVYWPVFGFNQTRS